MLSVCKLELNPLVDGVVYYLLVGVLMVVVWKLCQKLCHDMYGFSEMFERCR